MKAIPANTIDAVVTDPPYGLSFMGKAWDYDVPSVEIWKEVLRVLKPGGHLLSFGGTRTYHRMVVAIEDAGFEIRDQLQWLTGQGFPKSLNVVKDARKQGLACDCEEVSKHDLRPVREADLSSAIDPQDQSREALQPRVSQQSASCKESPEAKALAGRGEEPGLEGRDYLQAKQGELHRPEVRSLPAGVVGDGPERRVRNGASAGAGDAHRKGTKPGRSGASHKPQHARQLASEPGALAKQPPSQVGRAWATCNRCGKPTLEEIAGYGTALKPANEPICLARKPISENTVADNVLKWGTGGINVDGCRIAAAQRPLRVKGERGREDSAVFNGRGSGWCEGSTSQGRWPANILLDEVAAEMLDAQSGQLISGANPSRRFSSIGHHGTKPGERPCNAVRGVDKGGASRFFYVAKVSSAERNAGLEGMPDREGGIKNSSGRGYSERDPHKPIVTKNHHPTVKPVKLMEYLCRLITPPGGRVLDPFMGSGSTGLAAQRLGLKFVGIERDEEFYKIAQARMGQEG